MDDGAEINEAVEAKQGGETIGYVITATDPNGYGGDIQVSVGIQNDGTVNGNRVFPSMRLQDLV